MREGGAPRGLALALAFLALGPGLAAWPSGPVGWAQAPAPAPKFDAADLDDPAKIRLGRQVWQDRCQFCHGRLAYPGKAPKLEPARYTPAFVYDRVSNGFQGMPPWKGEYSEDQLKAVVAYVLSREFPN